MRKLLTVLFVLCCIIACNDDKNDDSSKITVPAGTNMVQKALANEEKPDGDGFTFTAPAPWTATVRETTTRSNSVSWLRILIDGKETYSGQAGTFILTIELDPNYSGASRSASIIIETGDDRIAVTVTQSNEKEDGTILEIPKVVTGIKITQVKNSEYEYHPLEYQFLYDDKTFRLKEFWVKEYDQTLIFTYDYNFLDGVRITDNKENVFTATLNDKGYVTRIQTNDGSDRSFSYNANDYANEIDDEEDEENGWVWEDGNLIGTELEWISEEDDLVVRYPNRFSQNLNNKTNIDLNVLFYYITQYPYDYSSLYESELPLFALIDKTGKRSKNYMVWTAMNSLLDAGEESRIYTKETEPEIGEVRRISYSVSKEKNASYKFDTEDYPVSFTQNMTVVKTTTTYEGDRNYITPENNDQKEALERAFGPGPWFRIEYQYKKSNTTDILKATISYNK